MIIKVSEQQFRSKTREISVVEPTTVSASLTVVCIVPKIILQLGYILYYNLTLLRKKITTQHTLHCYIVCNIHTYPFVVATLEEYKEHWAMALLPENLKVVFIDTAEKLPVYTNNIQNIVNTYIHLLPASATTTLFLSDTCLLNFNSSEYEEVMERMKQHKMLYSFFTEVRWAYLFFDASRNGGDTTEQYSTICEDIYENEELCAMLTRIK